MRSKEVEEGIYRLQQAIDYDKEHRLVTIYDEKTLTRDLYQAVLNYISELEEELDSARRKNESFKNQLDECIYEDVIRDKIKELDDYYKSCK